MPLRLPLRVVRAYVEALELGSRIKPFQAAKRRVFSRYGILGSKYDRVFTALVYRMQRLQGIIDKILEHYLRGEDRRGILWQAARLIVTAKLFGKVEDEVFLDSLVKGMSRVLEGKRVGSSSKLLSLLKYLDNVNVEELVDPYELKLLLPRLLIEKLKLLLPESEIEEFARAVNSDRPLLGFRINRLKASVKEILEALRSEGVEAWPSSRVEYHIVYRGSLNYSKFKPLLEGKVVPQDEASAAAGELLGAGEGELVVDMCAAPGGKTTHLAEISGNRATIVAIDIFSDRLARLRELAERTGTSPAIVPVRSDAIYASRIMRVKADRVLLDPPCTSTGAIHKHPEARWRLSRRAIVEHVGLQRRLLWEAVELLKPGGLLLYTVCSVLPEEGEENVKWLLSVRNDVELVPLNGPYDESPLLPGTMRSWPHRHGTTGFFYALLRRVRD